MATQTIGTAGPETLRFGYGDTALGTIVVADSMRGVVAIFIGNDRTILLRELKLAFRDAEFVLDQTGLAQTIAKATALIDAPQRRTDMTLDLRGSPREVLSGRRCRRFPQAKRAPTARSREACRWRRRPRTWVRPALRTGSRSPCPATVS